MKTSSNSSAADLKSDLIRYAQSLGFERVGIARAQALVKEEASLINWIAEGRAGEMDYLARDPERRARPAELLPGAKSVIALAMAYSGGGSEDRRIGAEPPTRRPEEGRVARYTKGNDYHKVIRKRLDSVVRYVEAMSPGAECRTFVDTGPLLERAVAQRAGLGFIGKNTMLITKSLGSWVFLASIITTVELAADAPDDRSCGECRLCIDACPTQAITEPFKLDARLCIAYLTIEQRGAIPDDLKPKTGPWVFGCDICQEVCPHNARRSGPGLETGLEQMLNIQTDEEFSERFRGTAFARAGRVGMIRNACVAAANLGRRDLLGSLRALASSENALVREHAAWAVGKLDATSDRKNASSQAPESGARHGEAAIHH